MRLTKGLLKRLEPYHLTPFQMKVLDACYSIPKGKTASYKEIAIKIGHPNAQRAVGTALKNNPIAPTIPCHRVIKSSGELGNYSGKNGPRGKRELLIKERAIKANTF